MTLEEAQKVGKIIGTADHGCSVCVGDLVERLNHAFPEFSWEMKEEVYEGDGLAVEVKPK